MNENDLEPRAADDRVDVVMNRIDHTDFVRRQSRNAAHVIEDDIRGVFVVGEEEDPESW
jgi:hypothetical protein